MQESRRQERGSNNGGEHDPPPPRDTHTGGPDMYAMLDIVRNGESTKLMEYKIEDKLVILFKTLCIINICLQKLLN